MGFLEWLKKQEARKDPIGDVARDTFIYDAPTAEFARIRDFLDHIAYADGCRGARLAAVQAFAEYRRQQPRGRQSIPRALRFKILSRDGFHCRTCGRGTEQGVALEIDHRVSVRDGGGTHEGNLWTLCFDCNRGKHAGSIR